MKVLNSKWAEWHLECLKDFPVPKEWKSRWNGSVYFSVGIIA
jgi:hypothetical protein